MRSISNLFIFLGFIAGCTSNPKSALNSYEEKVVSRIDGLKERPSWIKESESFKLEDDKVISMGTATIPGDDRIEAGYRIAENNAKVAIASGIENKLEAILQNAEEGTAIDTTQLRFIGSEVTSLTTSAIRPAKRYWEKVVSMNTDGNKVVRFKIFATVVMPEKDFKSAVLAAIRKSQSKGGLSKSFAEKVDKQWDSLIEKTQQTE